VYRAAIDFLWTFHVGTLRIMTITRDHVSYPSRNDFLVLKIVFDTALIPVMPLKFKVGFIVLMKSQTQLHSSS